MTELTREELEQMNAQLREQNTALDLRCAELEADAAVALNRLITDAQIDAVFDAMPDGVSGFLKSWGYRQFARAVVDVLPAAGEGYVGESEQADFEYGTWTFKMKANYQVGAGLYRIIFMGPAA